MDALVVRLKLRRIAILPSLIELMLMKLTKFGHCCFLVDTSTSLGTSESGARIITDPAGFSTGQNSAKNIDLILITHKDRDHLEINSLKTILQNNPNAKIITNKSVGEILAKENIPYTILEQGQSATEKGVLIEGFGEKHAMMHPSIPQWQNTGYFIANKLFYPGDAFTNPGKPVEILALPVVAPWLKISESIDYALELKPRICFGVHDGISKLSGFAERFLPPILEPKGIKFVAVPIDQEIEI